MLITITKKPEIIRQASYELLSAGTQSGVWFEEEADQNHKSLGNKKADFDA